ncbi:hypothetical protein [Spirosoma sordidisoli]|uniref:Uncharacterized protein n=1 Tax=Spirosoma sordidisoli TaxID=2502893 RepID=A0A4Q2UKS7_9BACT|nr:hypothetical protein [Spirosoma sordidisoli]RYC69836.1 hypothetical protein EQG79_14680 [Spirosoma sordidisoli]
MTMQPAAYNRKPNTGTPKFEADPINSTFRWELYLTPGNARNRISLMDGYSKGMGFENPNKVLLLYRKLINPLLPYLSRCDAMVIYEQVPGLPKELHTKVLEIYSNQYRAHGWVKDTAVITEYLDNYFNHYVRTGTMPPLEDRRKNVRQPVYMQELDHTKHHFATLDELRVFCRSRSEKYSEICMRGWYYRHAEYQPELFENEVTDMITDALAHQVHTATTYEEAERAQNSLTNLLTKHKSNR